MANILWKFISSINIWYMKFIIQLLEAKIQIKLTVFISFSLILPYAIYTSPKSGLDVIFFICLFAFSKLRVGLSFYHKMPISFIIIIIIIVCLSFFFFQKVRSFIGPYFKVICFSICLY